MDNTTARPTRKFRVTVFKTVREYVTVEVPTFDAEGMPISDDDCRYHAADKAFAKNAVDSVGDVEPVDD